MKGGRTMLNCIVKDSVIVIVDVLTVSGTASFPWLVMLLTTYLVFNHS
jgi:hypothetical protein